jgi:hypothetical protein
MYRHVGPKTRYQMREKLAANGVAMQYHDPRGDKLTPINGQARKRTPPRT